MFAGCLYPCGARVNVTAGCSINLQVRNGKQPYSRYIFLNMCNDATRLSFGSSIKLARQFNLFPPRARLVDVGEWNATSGARETHAVFLVIEHPYDSLMRVRPDAEVRMPQPGPIREASSLHSLPCPRCADDHAHGGGRGAARRGRVSVSSRRPPAAGGGRAHAPPSAWRSMRTAVETRARVCVCVRVRVRVCVVRRGLKPGWQIPAGRCRILCEHAGA
jgi:hypothetical protein